MGHAVNGLPLIAPHRLSTVVGAIYDSAIDPDSWREALGELCVDLRCMLSAIYLFDAQQSSVQYVRASDDGAEQVVRDKDYLETMVGCLRLMPVGTWAIDEPVASSSVVADFSVFMGSRYFQEVCIPNGHSDGIHVVLARNSRRFGLFSAIRHQSKGPVDGADLAVMRLFAPHIRRAVTISDLMELKA